MTSEHGQSPLDTSQFDAFVEGLDYPMFVVTTCAQERAGCLVGFITQASIDPPRLLVCLSVQNHTYRVARDASFLAVHVLGPDEDRLARLFGEQTGDQIDKFARCSWRAGPGGVPLLEDCPRFVLGRVLEQVPLGDHVGFLLQPVAVESGSSVQGLTFEDVEDMSPGHPA